MADQKLTALSEISVPALEDLGYTVDDPSGTPVSNSVTWARLLGQLLPAICEGRLSTETGVPVSTSDRTSQGTIYFTPYLGARVSLYDGTRWKLFAFTELSLALSSLTSGKNYDVFLYDNSGTLTLELSAAWTNDTTRADALTTQDGIPVKSGSTTRRLVGTIRTTGTTTTEDSAAKRFVWSLYNRVARPLRGATETADTWTHTSTTFRQANANSANQLAYVVGMTDPVVRAHVLGLVYNANNVLVTVGVGVDSSTVNSAHGYGTNVFNFFNHTRADYVGQPGLGYHELRWLEASTASGTTNWYGDNGTTLLQSGIWGELLGG
jgi:hypothetical protein